jgi:peptidoglycan/xylan/chitin deacetylase (PgdA/CDA1 family)
MRSYFKQKIASLVNWVRLDQSILFLTNKIFSPYIRVINYHGTPLDQAENFERQIKYYLTKYFPATLTDLKNLIDGVWPYQKPGIILSFDDGLRSNFEVAIPILEKYGFTGLFFIPPGFIDEPMSTAPQFCRRNLINGVEALKVAEVQYLARQHYIGSHSYHHIRLKDGLSAEEIQMEVVESRKRLEEMTHTQVRNFAWVGGENWSYGRDSAVAIGTAGYQLVFAGNSLPVTSSTDPFWIYRTNVESDWSIDLVRVQLSGLADLWHWPSRARLRRNLYEVTK